MSNLFARYVIAIVALLFTTAGLIVARWPEPAARPLIGSNDWATSSHIGRITFSEFSESWRQTRRSLQENGVLFRTWTPEAGAQPGEVTSPPFRATPIISVAIAGTTAAYDGSSTVYLSCDAHVNRRLIFRGDVNINLMEALVQIDDAWCPGWARLHLESRTPGVNVGVGTVAEVAPVSAWKRSALGLFPFLVISLLVYSAAGVLGAFTLRLVWTTAPAALAAAIGFGFTALATFFAYAVGPSLNYGFILATLLILGLSGLAFARPQSLRALLDELAPAGAVWFAASCAYFFFSIFVSNGLGHWEPNFRFAPAIWSSDNELPLLFAEALRHGWDLPSLFGGVWGPTDRPPLMVGALLMTADLFSALQAGNDGVWLRGTAHNIAAIAVNSLWALVFFVLLQHILKLEAKRAVFVTLVAAAIPFFLFNSIYGWPKLISAAFAGVAIWAAFEETSSLGHRSTIFGAASALSLLCHTSSAIFLLPLSCYFLITRLRRSPAALASGVSVGLGLLLPWMAYQHFLLPTNHPLIKFALTGDFGFADPSRSLGESIRVHYENMTLSAWLEGKTAMLIELFAPSETLFQRVPGFPLVGYETLDTLRQWDFYFLSGGNAPLLLAAGLALLVSRHPTRRPIYRLSAVASASYAVMLLLFFSPMIIHHTPYGALFTVALVGLGGSALYASTLFRWIALATMIYTAIVWGLLPFREALHIDWIAGGGLAFTLTLAIRFSWPARSSAAPPTERQAV